MSLIEAPGAYPDISMADYHGRANLLPGSSISSSGMKLLLTRSPAHYWWQSPLNPDRPAEPDKPHFNVGRAAHDLILTGDGWAERYHVTPEGFSRAKTKQLGAEIAEADEAEAAGKSVLSFEQAASVQAMAASIRRNPLAVACLTNGQPEVTLAWQDKETGVWLRARPDFLPNKRQIIPDLKTCADASPRTFERTIANMGYHLSAALYLEGIAAVFGDRPSNWLHIAVEKEPPHVVALYELPHGDISRGRFMVRRAIRMFADCLSADRWPGYADEPVQVGLPAYERKIIDEGNAAEVADLANGMAFAA